MKAGIANARWSYIARPVFNWVVGEVAPLWITHHVALRAGGYQGGVGQFGRERV